MNAIEQGGRFRIGGELEIHRLAYGALHLLDVGPDAFGPAAPGDPTAFLRHVVELGIDLIDTADVYGPGTNELQISTALHPYPKGITISTKGGLSRPQPGELEPHYDRQYLRSAVEGSLRRLKIEQIAVWTLHHVDASTPIEEVVGILADLQCEGKLRHIGLSKASVGQLERARAIAPISMVQNRYNVGDRRDDAVVEYCELHGIGFMAFFPLASGHFDRLRACVGDVADARGVSIQQIALAWLLRRSPVLIPIPGTRFAAELEDNVAACAIELSAQEVARIDARYAELPPIAAGPSPIRTRAAPVAGAAPFTGAGAALAMGASASTAVAAPTVSPR